METDTMSTEIGTLLVSSSDVCGGRMRVEGSRVTVTRIVVSHKRGNSPEEIAAEYPELTLAQVYAALAYYHANQEEIEADLAAERTETHDQSEYPNDPLEKEFRLEAFKALQENLNLTPEKAAEWQDAVREARR